MNTSKWFLAICLIALIAVTRVRAQQEFDTADLFDDEEDDEPEPIAKRQFNAMRDTIRNAFTNSIRFLSSGRLVNRITQALQSVRPVPSAISNAASSVASSAASSVASAASQVASAATGGTLARPANIGSVFRGMRTAWSRRSQQGQTEFRKRLADITKRLTNNRIIIGGMSQLHKLQNREESAIKATAKAIEVPQPKVQIQTKFVPVLPQFIPVPIYPQW